MNESSARKGKRRVLLAAAVRLVCIVLLAMVVGAVLTRVAASHQADGGAAGFGKGVLQGALMPMAMPNLLVGRDVPIYAERNTGRTYKLGYTVGVNACGALFFGLLFWRLHRLRKFAESIGGHGTALANPDPHT
jgi:hypothetical protein